MQAKHSQPGNATWGINGNTGQLVDMKELGIWDPLSVKLQVYKTAVEVKKENRSTSLCLGTIGIRFILDRWHEIGKK